MKQTGYGNIKTKSESDLEFITNDKECYLSSMEYTLSDTSSDDGNAYVLGCALDFFSF